MALVRDLQVNGLLKYAEALHALDSLMERPDHDGVDDDPPCTRAARRSSISGSPREPPTKAASSRSIRLRISTASPSKNSMFPAPAATASLRAWRPPPASGRSRDTPCHPRCRYRDLPGPAPDINHPVARANVEFRERDCHDLILCRSTFQSHRIPDYLINLCRPL